MVFDEFTLNNVLFKKLARQTKLQLHFEGVKHFKFKTFLTALS